MSLDQLYQQIILEHSKARHGSGLADAGVPEGASSGQSHQLNPVCGDEITLRIAVAGGKVSELRWDGEGCSISMASASVLTDLAEGLEPVELHRVIDSFREVLRSRGKVPADPEVLGDAAAFEGVSRYAARVKCAMLSWVAAEDALGQAESHQHPANQDTTNQDPAN
ncbi:SUF system NifU family Fe-S cluster assembly protein [Arthrobacter sp. KBS0702]|uniref:Fe-S cluster assembly sulfur transfer protein SufU n=1 Tax=Arthrobacter sp. KBS0702 TaxID=2578107 RepID=UPI00110E04DF|nr:SUF system NifU family Fe-S cluster assembly protein [Arthrobacter sp. KBS0702]QDW29169.1 SUF system NifU family Fe-S cluster assembly protein [Arthrobacter sp. KBS0702]